MRTVFLGSPPFATPVFEALCESRHRPLALVTRPDRPRGRGRGVERSVLSLAADAQGIEVLQPADPHDGATLERLRALEPDVLFVASFGVIMKASLLELAPHGALNAHASLLPRHRGASPIQAAILAGDLRTGVSIQRIVSKLDAGDVVHAVEHEIGPEETSGALLSNLSRLGGVAAVEALDMIEAGTATFEPQDPGLVTHARKLAKHAGRIDWTFDAEHLVRHVRAMSPWPGAQCLDPRGKRLQVLRARALPGTASARPGELIEAAERLVVAAGSGGLELVEVAPAGKRPMAGGDYLRGARLEAGSHFELEQGEAS